MNIIPTQPVASSFFSVTLGGQNCQIAVYQKTTGLFLDLSVNGVQLVGCVLCHDRVRLVREAYLGFIGDLTFIDTQGLADPVYTGLGSRWVLVYLTPADVAANS